MGNTQSKRNAWWEKWLFVVLAVGFPALMINLKLNGIDSSMLLGYAFIAGFSLAAIGLAMFLLAFILR